MKSQTLALFAAIAMVAVASPIASPGKTCPDKAGSQDVSARWGGRHSEGNGRGNGGHRHGGGRNREGKWRGDRWGDKGNGHDWNNDNNDNHKGSDHNNGNADGDNKPDESHTQEESSPEAEAPAPAPEPESEVSNPSTSGGEVFQGQASWYKVDNPEENHGYAPGTVACSNTKFSNEDFIVALNEHQYDSSHCGRNVVITDKATGKTVTAAVQDRCVGCVYGKLDLTPAVFTALHGNLDDGLFDIKWQFA